MSKNNIELNIDSVDIDNNNTFLYYYNKLLMLLLSRYEWNLPPEINSVYMERTLITHGAVVFFYDKDMGENGQYLCLPVTLDSSDLNVYNIPIRRIAYASNGYIKHLSEKNSVIIYNNVLRLPDINVIKMFANRLAIVRRTIDININAQKTPILINCSDKDYLSLKNTYKKYSGNEPVIFSIKPLSENISILRTDAPYLADKLENEFTTLWNECLTHLGISNIAIDKKERLITDEVNRSMGGVIASRFSSLNSREQGCKEINKMFNINASVKFNEIGGFNYE